MTEIELVLFLEWLDVERVVIGWENAHDTHEGVAQRYLDGRGL